MNKLFAKAAKVTRVLTTAPVLAAIFLTLLHALTQDTFSATSHYLRALFYLTILPALAYPVAWLVPKLHQKGREGERNLAIAFSVIGYVLGFVDFVFTGTPLEKVVFGTYLLSGILIAATTKLHFKASGHACGVSGPMAVLCHSVNPLFALGYGLLAFVFWSSLQLKRHTVAQLVVGTLIPVMAMYLNLAIFCR